MNRKLFREFKIYYWFLVFTKLIILQLLLYLIVTYQWYIFLCYSSHIYCCFFAFFLLLLVTWSTYFCFIGIAYKLMHLGKMWMMVCNIFWIWNSAVNFQVSLVAYRGCFTNESCTLSFSHHINRKAQSLVSCKNQENI